VSEFNWPHNLCITKPWYSTTCTIISDGWLLCLKIAKNRKGQLSPKSHEPYQLRSNKALRLTAYGVL
jgi:hypothetical protein